MDWCHLYYNIKSHSHELNGLRDRERIWTKIEEILRGNIVYRGEGGLPVWEKGVG